jgi:hypothetical protein
MLSLLTASLLAFVPKIQEPPAPAQPAPEAAQEPVEESAPAQRESRRKPQMAPNEPDAEAFLAKLVAAQQIEDDLPPVTAFRMEFVLRDFQPDRGGNELDVRVDFRSADAPRRDRAVDEQGKPLQGFEEIRLTANDASFNELVSKGLDADGYWLRDEKGKLLTLEAKEYANDRETIDQTLTFCEDFLLLFDLDQLRKRAGGLKLDSSDTETTLIGEMLRGREVWRFRLVVAKGEALPSRLELELPESAQVKTEPLEVEQAAQGTPVESPALGPQILTYFFGKWEAHAGRLLPLEIDEFHGVVTPDNLPRRALDVKRFLWRVPAEIKTWRGDERTSAGSTKPPTESRD